MAQLPQYSGVGDEIRYKKHGNPDEGKGCQSNIFGLVLKTSKRRFQRQNCPTHTHTHTRKFNITVKKSLRSNDLFDFCGNYAPYLS